MGKDMLPKRYNNKINGLNILKLCRQGTIIMHKHTLNIKLTECSQANTVHRYNHYKMSG